MKNLSRLLLNFGMLLHVYSVRHLEPQGGSLIFSYLRRLGPFFGVQNFELQYFRGVSEKKEYFLGYEGFVDICWGHQKIGLYIGVISMHFRVFSL